tara:strand:- start:1434 stop:1580 length:147 start_codon:yes stop_codon:yes gene_type:complete
MIKITEEEKRVRRQKYNQTYYQKHRMKMLQKYRDTFVSKKIRMDANKD